MGKASKDERLKEIKELLVSFCVKYLNEELQGYVLRLCDTLYRKRKISVSDLRQSRRLDCEPLKAVLKP